MRGTANQQPAHTLPRRTKHRETTKESAFSRVTLRPLSQNISSIVVMWHNTRAHVALYAPASKPFLEPNMGEIRERWAAKTST